MAYKTEINNEQTRKANKNSNTHNTVVVTRGKLNEGVVKVKEVKHEVTEDDLTLGGGHPTQCRDDVSYNCTVENYIIILNNVAPINLI